MIINLKKLTDFVVRWADGVYPERTPSSAFMKLFSELGELIDNPNDPLEYADIFIIMLDLANMHGVDIEKAIIDKININQRRSWGISDLGVLHNIKPGVTYINQFSTVNVLHNKYYEMGVQDFNDGNALSPESYLEYRIDPEFLEHYERGYINAAGE